MKLKKRCNASIFYAFIPVMACIIVCARAWAEIEILRNPADKVIKVGSIQNKILLKTTPMATGVKYKWSKQGPGEFKSIEDSGSIFYIVPSSISGDSEKIIIIVEAIDEMEKTIDTGITTFELVWKRQLKSIPFSPVKKYTTLANKKYPILKRKVSETGFSLDFILFLSILTRL